MSRWRLVYFLLVVACFILKNSEASDLDNAVKYHLIIMDVPGNPDGYPRPVIGVYDAPINLLSPHEFHPPLGVDPFPGPVLRAKIGQVMSVKITNMLVAEATSVHFHGLHMENNPWMDGVGHITECGIASHGGSFTYTFNITQTGTFWYHSHSASQYADGLLGAIVLEYANVQIEDPVYLRFPYQRESLMMLQDWFHETSDTLRDLYSGQRNIYAGFSPQYPWPTTNLLLNGRGKYDCSRIERYNSDLCNATYVDPCSTTRLQCIPERLPFYGECRDDLNPPVADFQCDAGQLMRVRVINGASNVPMMVAIQNHSIIVVAKDGVETLPNSVSALVIAVGQRYDLILNCSQHVGSFAINITIPNTFLPAEAVIPNTFVQAKLIVSSGDRNGNFELNPSTNFNDNITPGVRFEYQQRPLLDIQSPGADERIILWYNVDYNISSGHPLEHWVINGLRFEMPSFGAMLHEVVFNSPFSNPVLNYTNQHKHLNTIHLKRGVRYEIVIFGADSGQQHPWHMHGYSMDFIKVGQVNLVSELPVNGFDDCGYPLRNVSQLDWNNILDWSEHDDVPVLTRGDSFTVPVSSYVAFRFTANNLGPWLCHCHVDWHMHMGMSFLVSVEDDNGGYGGIEDPPGEAQLCGSLGTISSSRYDKSMTTTIPNTCGEGGYRPYRVWLGIAIGSMITNAFMALFIIIYWARTSFLKIDQEYGTGGISSRISSSSILTVRTPLIPSQK